MWISHPHMWRTHLNHVASPWNLELRLVLSNKDSDQVIMFEASEMMCVELRAKNYEMCIHIDVYVNLSSSHVKNTPQSCRQSTKLRTKISSIKPKIVVKFEASKMMCVEFKKLWNVYTLLMLYVYWGICESRSHPHMWRTHLNHVTSPWNLELRLVVSKQR